MMEFKEIEKLVKKKLSRDPYRLEHVKMCRMTAEDLARAHNADWEKVRIAAMLHDVTKLDSEQEQIMAIKRCFDESYLEKYPKELWHALSAVCYAKEVCQIRDEEILDAILYHPTGRPDMSLLEKIVFVSDSVEPGRAHETASIRELATRDIDSALIRCLEAKLRYLKENGMKIVPLTEDAIQYYRNYKGGH